MSVLIVTSVGDIVLDLHTDRCPLTTKNFLKLCKIKYYNGCLFHKVEKDFLAQTGDPTGTGTGGNSIYKINSEPLSTSSAGKEKRRSRKFLYGEQARFFEHEIRPELKHSKKGTVSMVSAGENLNASQFFFTLRDDIDYLDEKHTVFGMVEEKESFETLEKINEAFVDDKGRPLKNIRIKHTYVLDDPFDDPPMLTELIPDSSPDGRPNDETVEERLEDDWVPLDEQMKPEELEELIHSKEAHTNAVVLESIGDIPDAEIKPPDNVLFVCKLNPVTEDEDLFTIFSRFGTVTSAEIIRDYKTGDSLCYAFIEFEKKEDCERAYFKMDNTLIDDRRIHVDFSQSVSKLWGQYRHGKKNQKDKGGCFKCGATDHYAKDCDGEKDGKKYVLKDENTQRGGHNNHKYDMVFDEDRLDREHKKRRVHEESTRKDRDHKDSDRGHHRSQNNEEERDYRSRYDGEERGHKSRYDGEERGHKSRYHEEERGHKSRDRGEDENRRRKEIESREYKSRERDEGGDRRRDERDYRKGSGERDRYKHHEGHRHNRDGDKRAHREREERDNRR
ncbi:Peptidyl-prolyl cis-trans isomerase-like protein 4 [Rhynchospora pubera]|uniref:Peptidyl-prolyl cis-trans isomerase n=1 Tax=Rhynchospora pubera TaxID=906938 RepID=A0AAV8DQM2_9POAL|nr:Peptidyl-prolyl cis-trans isomerase-like protein 4 [Rhynchospora pubera]